MDFSNMTFKDYNTKAAYDDKGSSAKGLVAAYKKENPNGSAEDFFSKLAPEWNTENVKKEIALAYPKAEEKKESAPAVQKDPNLSKGDEKTLNETNAVANQAENDELARQREQNEQMWNDTMDNLSKQGENFRNIDDHMVDNLPKFVWDAYKNDEFGKAGTKEAKQKLAHFIMSDLGVSLKGISNLFMSMSGKSPIFSGDDLQSDYSKYKKTNLEEGMKNRWAKYEAETKAATNMLIERGKSNEEINNAIRQIASNRRMQTAFNMMDDKQKAYLIDVYTQIGDKIGGMNNDELVNFLAGAALSGQDLDWKEALGILATRIPALRKRLGMKAEEAKSVTGIPDENNTQSAGIGGGVQKKTTLSDGSDLNSGLTMNKKERDAAVSKADELLQAYYDGKITEEQLEKDYKKIESYIDSHPLRKLISGGVKSLKAAKAQVRGNKLSDLSLLYEKLNESLESGAISETDYDSKLAELRADAQKWGASEKQLKAFDKNANKTKKKAKK